MPTDKYGHTFLGVNYSTPPHELPATALADARNVVPTASGLPTGRKGSVSFNNTSLGDKVTSFFEFRSGSTRKQICSYGTVIADYSSATREFTDRITSLTSEQMFQWINFAGKAIGVNGVNAPQYYTDSTTNGDLAGSPPVGLCLTEWAHRLWFGGDTTNVATLTGSYLNSPIDWSTNSTASGYISQSIGDPKDAITGLIGFFDMLLIGKKNNIYKLTGDPATDATSIRIDPLYSKSTDNIGFTSKWAMTQVGNDIIFLDGFDIKRLSGIEQYGDVEYASVIPHFRDYLKSIADRDYLQYTQFFHYKQQQQVWVSIPTSSTTYFVFVLDYRFKDLTGSYAFYPMSDLTVACFGGMEDGDVTNMYYGDETGKVHQLDVGNDDNGSAIERYFVKVFSGNSPERGIIDGQENRKHFVNTEAFITSEQDTLTMTPYYATDLMDDAQVRDSDNYTALDAETVTGWNGTGVKTKRVPLFGVSGNTLALKWLNDAVNQNFTFYPSGVQFNWKSKNTVT